ncbi:MAG: ABC transporter permease [Hyphomicrobium sp.]|nr:ABC transporter permease [Hyphomicrobium sp.]MBN9265980.1 ABC transporter permease [Hyphomicrobium sp.]MBN9279538.1 ABC transporter permease [Hyphomicrobium sp.]
MSAPSTDIAARRGSPLAIMARVVAALLLRETRVRFGRAQIGYLWAIIEPLGGVLVLAFAFQLIGRVPDVGQSLLLFLAIGMLGFSLQRRLTVQLGNAFDANKALLHFPVVKRIDTLIARSILEIATSLLSMMIIIAGLVLIDGAPPPARLDIFVAGIAALALLGFGLGTLNAILNAHFRSWRHIEGLISRPLFLMSGVFFTPVMLPSAVSDILAWNPVLHGIEWLRYGYYEGYRPDFISAEYLIGWGLTTTLAGLAAERFLPPGEA